MSTQPAPNPFNTAQVASLQADINKGLADIAAGLVHDFDIAVIIEQGRRLFKKT